MDRITAHIRRIGWLAVEAGLIIIALCIILDILLGPAGGSFVTSVANNATHFLQTTPPGTFLGVVLILLIYKFVRSRLGKPEA